MHRIGETIGDAWPLVAVDRVHRGGKWARDRQTFNKNKKHLTDHDAAIRHDGSLDRLSACVNATAASPLGDVHGIKRPIAPDAAPMSYPIAASVATSRSATSSGCSASRPPRRGIASARAPNDDP